MYSSISSIITVCLISILKLGYSSAFNNFIDKNHPIVINDTSIEESHFGYSISGKNALGNQPSKIYIGAPKGSQSVPNKRPQMLTQTGVLWECDLQLGEITKQDINCRMLDFTRGQPQRQLLNSDCFDTNYGSVEGFSDDMWLGVSAIVPLINRSESVITCGYRWRTASKPLSTIFGGANEDETQKVNGHCYRRWSDGRTSSLLPSTRRGSQCNKVECEYSLFGFSIAASGNEILVGVPGYTDYTKSYSAKGNAILISLKDQVSPCQQENEFNTLIPNLRNHPAKYNWGDTDYLGYSVAIGSSFGIGAPRGRDLKGYVIDAKEENFFGNQPTNFVSGDQLGSYFGSVIAFANLDGDSVDELIVGSPLYNRNLNSQDSHDEGCIYIYRKTAHRGPLFGNTDNRLCISDDSGGRFGSAIANIGDINYDGYEEIAVGAPGADDGMGKVYIFFGNATRESPFIISGKDINQEFGLKLKGFGSTLTGKVDVDGNLTPDLLIGSWQSKQMFVFRTRPKLEFKDVQINYYKTKSDQLVDKFNRDDTQLVVRLCFSPKRTPAVDGPITVNVEVTVDTGVFEPRFQFLETKNKVQQFKIAVNKAKESVCRQLEIILLKELDPSDAKQIEFQWRFSYQNEFENQKSVGIMEVGKAGKFSPGKDFCPWCPISGNMTFTDSLQISQDNCNDDGNLICTSNLDVIVKILAVSTNKDALRESYEYTAGSNEPRFLDISITNTKETAYNPTISVKWTENFPKKIPNLIKINQELYNQNCKLNHFPNSFICECSKPLHKSLQLRFKIDFESTIQATPTPWNLKFEVSAYPKIFVQQTKHASPKTIKVVSDIQLTLNSLEEQKIPVSSLQFSPEISNNFELGNAGITSLSNKDVYLQFEIPQIFKDKSGVLSKAIIIYHPSTKTENAIVCNTPDGFSIRENKVAIPTNSSIITDQISSRHRKRRNTGDEIKMSPTQTDSKFNREMIRHIDCTLPEWTCVTVNCNLEIQAQSATTIELMMALNQTIANEHFADATVMVFKVLGRVWTFDINPNTVITATSSTQLILRLDNSVPAWVVFVSAIGGLIIFLMITVCLMKCGFFRRKTKENLENLKAQTQQEELLTKNFQLPSDDAVDQEHDE